MKVCYPEIPINIGKVLLNVPYLVETRLMVFIHFTFTSA